MTTRVVVCMDGNPHALRMGCLTTLLRLLEISADIQIDYVADETALHAWVRRLATTEKTEGEECWVYAIRASAEILDPGTLVRHVRSGAWKTPFEVLGIEELRGWKVDVRGDRLVHDVRRAWFVRVFRPSEWRFGDETTVFPTRSVPLTTSVPFTFRGDFGRRNLLRIR